MNNYFRLLFIGSVLLLLLGISQQSSPETYRLDNPARHTEHVVLNQVIKKVSVRWHQSESDFLERMPELMNKEGLLSHLSEKSEDPDLGICPGENADKVWNHIHGDDLVKKMPGDVLFA